MPEHADRHRTNPPPTSTRSLGLRLLATALFGFILFGLWLVLSPNRDLFHLWLGALTACVITLLSDRLVMQPPPIAGPDGRVAVLQDGNGPAQRTPSATRDGMHRGRIFGHKVPMTVWSRSIMGPG